MANGLHADTAGIDTEGLKTISYSEDFYSNLRDLRQNIEGLMGIWKGLSSQKFYDSFAIEEKELLSFQSLLNQLGEAIRQGATILQKTEEENADAGAHLFN